MFVWRTRDYNLDPYFRAVYAMQTVAALAVLLGFFLIWWDGDESQTVFHLLKRSVDLLLDRDPSVIGQPLVVLWLLWPVLFAGLLRGIMGIMVQPVAYRALALVAWIAAMLILAHFYINFGGDLADDSPLTEGTIGIGYWLTTASLAILGLLIVAEFLIREPDPFIARQKRPSSAVDDAQRLWGDEYQTCSHCGAINQPDARACYSCNSLLFSFETKDENQS